VQMGAEDQPGSWRADPLGRYAYRWWDGTDWTASVSEDGSTAVTDPLGVAPSPPPQGPAPAPPTDALGSAESGFVDTGLTAPTGQAPAAPPPPSPPSAVAPLAAQEQYLSPNMQTPNFNLPGGGAWAAPQQLVVTNASKSPGMAIASLVLGVGAFFFSLLPLVGWASIPFAIVGFALGVAGVLRANKGFEGRGLSIAGIAGSLAALFVSAVYIFAVGAAVDDVPDVNSDPVDGVCDESRLLQDPDC